MKYIYSILLTFLSATISFAATRSIADATILAKKKLRSDVSLAQVKTHNADTLCFVFVRAGGGYAVISADDRTPEVLAYDSEKNFSGKFPSQLELLLSQYAGAVKDLPDGASLNAKPKRGLRTSHLLNCAVEPLLGDMAWGQEDPFNGSCPLDGSERSVAGCGAIAFAQVLNYYKYPDAIVNDIPSYFTPTIGKQLDGVKKGTPLDWDKIADNYVDGYTKAQAEAVANLVLYVAEALEMDFSSNSSGTYSNYVLELVEYFGYDPDLIRLGFRSSFTLEECNELFYGELKEGRPVLVSGSTIESGHAFVLDGIDNEGMFHINWGWDGDCNGYYDITLLNPGNTSAVGASSSLDGYSSDISFVYGIVPDNGVKDDVSADNVVVAELYYQYDGVEHCIFPSFYNPSGKTQEVSLALGYVDEDGSVVPLSFIDSDGKVTSIAPGGYYEVTEVLPINTSSFKEGKVYTVVLIQLADDGNSWKVCSGSENTNVSFTKKNGKVVKVDDGWILDAELTVNGFDKVDQPVYCNIHFTNKGTKEYYRPFYLLVNSEDQVPDAYIFGAGITVEPGNFSDIDFSIVPTSNTVYYWIVDDDFQTIKKGTFSLSGKKFLLEGSLSFVPSSEDAGVCKITVTNPNDYAYNELLALVIVDREHEGADLVENGRVCYIKPSETLKLELPVSDLSGVNDFYLFDAHGNIVACTHYSFVAQRNKSVELQMLNALYEKKGGDVNAKLFIGNYSDSYYTDGLVLWTNSVFDMPTEYVATYLDPVSAHSSLTLDVSFQGMSDSIYFWISDINGTVCGSGVFVASQQSSAPILDNMLSKLVAYTEGGTLIAEAKEDTPLMLFSAAGVCLAQRNMKQGERFTMNLAPGVYLVNRKKVVVW